MAVSVQPGHAELADISELAAIGDINDPATWCSCTIESLLCSAGEIIVLRVDGEIDLDTLPILQGALDRSFDQHPAHLVIDLAQMTFCSARGLTVLTAAGRAAAEKATGYAVSGVSPGLDRVWALLWDLGDRPVRYRSTAVAVTAIRATGRG